MAEDKKISELTQNPSINGSEEIAEERGGSNYKNTLTSVKDWILTFVTNAFIQSVRPIKTVNSESLEGVGNIVISGGVETVTGDGVGGTTANPVMSYPTPTDIGALTQGDNTLSETLKLGPFSPLIIANTFFEVSLTSIICSSTEISTGNTSSNSVNVGNVTSTVQSGSDLNQLLINASNGIVFKSEILGKGISFNDRAIDEANVDFSTDDNNLLSIGKAKENLLQQGTNTINNSGITSIAVSKTNSTPNLNATSLLYLDETLLNISSYSADNIGGFLNIASGADVANRVTQLGVTDVNSNTIDIKFNIDNGSILIENESGKGISFNDRTVDEDNVDFETDDNNLLSIGKAKENLQQKHTVTDFTDAFTIPNGTNNATLTMTNAVNKDVTISTTSFANVGDACELSSLLGVGYPIVVAGTGVALVDPNSVASDSFNIKGLRRMNDVGGVIQIQLY